MASELININVADAEILAQLPGVGDRIARRIIEYRQNVHPFEEIIELAAVPGVSERMVRVFEERLTIDSPPPPTPMAGEEPVEELESPPADVPGENGDASEGDEDAITKEPVAPESDTVAREVAFMEASQYPSEAAPVPVDLEEFSPALEMASAIDDLEVIGTVDIDDEGPLRVVPIPAVDDADIAAEIAAPSSQLEPSPTPQPDTARQAQTVPETTAPTPQPVARRGLDWRTVLIGAVAGYLLALLTLFLVNGGSLSFATSDEFAAGARRTDDLSSQLAATGSDVSSLAAQQSELAADLMTNSERVEELTGETSSLGASVAVLEDTSVGMQEELDDLGMGVEDLQAATSELDERLSVVARSAEIFDSFLVGLQDLLFNLKGPLSEDAGDQGEAGMDVDIESSTGVTTTDTIETEESEPGLTPEPEIPSATPTMAVPTPTPRSDGGNPAPTRTPRPTTTPIPLPTTTPVPDSR